MPQKAIKMLKEMLKYNKNDKSETFVFLALIAITATAIMSPPAMAMEINSYSIVSEIIGDRTIHQKMLIEIQNNGASSLESGSISAPRDSKIISITDNYGNLQYEIEKGTKTNIVFRFSSQLKSGEKRTVIIELETVGLLKNAGNYFEYLLVFTPKQNISGFEHLLKLPKGAKLYSPEQFAVVFPEAEVGEMNGAVTVKWNANIAAGEPQAFLARFRTETTDWNSIVEIIAIIAAAGILGRQIAAFLKKYSSKKTENSIINSLKLLNENERPVVESIVRTPGIKQNELREILNFKKSALSKIISRLEARNILERKKSGKINRIYPGERLKKQ